MKKQAKTQVEGTEFERSSGNLFADLGLAQPEELKTKLVLAMRLNERIKALHVQRGMRVIHTHQV